MIRIRQATDGDTRVFAPELPSWIIEWTGWVGVSERDGSVVALGIVGWDQWGRVWGFYDSRGCVSPFTMHRMARKIMGHLREVGVKELHAYCSDVVPNAEKWLRRLGFHPSLVLPPVPQAVWTCSLN